VSIPIVLETERVRLEPLEERHLPELVASCNDDALWEFTYQQNPFTNATDANAWLHEALSDPQFYSFAIVDKTTGTVIGSTRFGDIQVEHKKREIGWTFIARSHWRTHVNTECKFLLLRYAFEQLGDNRVQLKANGHNMRSRTAIGRIGASYEGTQRSVRIHPRTNVVHDISWYSILKEEWPRVKAQLQESMSRPPYTLGPKPR
jgi:N-acetyltransferase